MNAMRVELVIKICALTVHQGQLSVVVGRETTSGSLPGRWQLLLGSLPNDADADHSARALMLRLGLSATVVEQLKTYTPVAPSDETSTDVRSVQIAYFSLFPTVDARLRTSDELRLFAVADLLADASDSSNVDMVVLQDAIERVRAKLEYTTIATSLLPEPFTIPELRRVYEAVWGVAIHPANFRRKVLATDGFVVPTSAPEGSGAGQNHSGSPDLYRRGVATLLHPAMLRA
jgi:8-oxo-dGTP diphosphatase